jgi:hypothetical protein
MKYFFTLGFLLSFGSGLLSCSGPQTSKPTTSLEQADMHQTYDDSTLHNNVLPVLLPYNRLIAPAGHVVRYGSPDQENHSLDVQLVPELPLLAVEDRYGIALVDTAQRNVVARWTYTDDARYKGTMSTYSGLKVRREGGQIHLFWSAANGQNHQSYSTWCSTAIIRSSSSTAPPARQCGPSPLVWPRLAWH